MTPQHTGATTHDISSWGDADYETNQNLASIHSLDARPEDPAPSTPADVHYLAA